MSETSYVIALVVMAVLVTSILVVGTLASAGLLRRTEAAPRTEGSDEKATESRDRTA